jgi:TolB protein
MMGPRGGGEKKISDDPSDTAPAPSPDGSKIAFMSFNRSGNNWEIWTMNPDGTNLQQLTENNNADGLPTWSPDGQSIAFVSDRGGAWAVWVMNADGSNQRKLFDMKGSPDGNIIYDEFNSRGWLEERISWAP